MAERPLHRTSVEIFPKLPAEVGAGGTIVRRARVACSFGCSLRGAAVRIVDAAGTDLLEARLTTFRGGRNETGEWRLAVPPDAREWAWAAVFDGHEGEEVDHEGSMAEASTRIGCDSASLVVWGLGSPILPGARLGLKVGAKTTAGRPLAGSLIEVLDEAGRLAGESTLGPTPWPGTESLYWTEVEAVAPAGEGIATWSARLAGGEGGAAAFTVTTIRPPEATLTVLVVDRAAGTAIQSAEIRLRSRSAPTSGSAPPQPPAMLRAVTDASGTARVGAPKGTFELAVWKAGYRIPTVPVDLAADAAVRVEAELVPRKKKKEQQWM